VKANRVCWSVESLAVNAECLPDEGMYFIVSPKDIVTARQRDEDDHISWLLEHEMFVVSQWVTLTFDLAFCSAIR